MTLLWTTAVLAPVLVALALAVVGLQPSDSAGDRARARVAWLAPWTTLPALGLALAGPDAGTVTVPGLLLGTTLAVDGLARPLVLAVVLIYATALWTVAARRTHRSPLLCGVLLACYVGNLGALVAADAVTFYAFFALMSFAAYGLVVHRGTPAARRAGRTYIVLTVVSEVVVLAALMFVVTAGGRLLTDAPAAVAASPDTALIVVLLLVGFGIKAGTVPLHVWVAPAYGQAPAPGAAVLGGALSKVGIVGLLRFLPLGEAELPTIGAVLVGAGLLGMFGAGVVGVLQRDARTVLAYSSVSQLGLLALLVGAALLDVRAAPVCAVAAVLYVVHHGLAKATLFLGVPLWAARGALRSWVAVGSVLAALAIGGAPLTTGFVAKYAAKEAVSDVAGLSTAITVLGVVSTLILSRALWLLARHPPPPEEDLPEEDTGGPLATHGTDHPPHTSRGAVVAWSVLALAAATLVWAVAPAWLPAADRPTLAAGTVWDAAWPVLAGLALAAAARALTRRVPGLADTPVVPAGDLLVPVSAAGRAAAAVARRGAAGVGRRYRAARETLGPALDRVSVPALTERGEGRLGAWRVSGAALLVVAGLVLAVGWLG